MGLRNSIVHHRMMAAEATLQEAASAKARV
jgi:hypothetical protein